MGVRYKVSMALQINNDQSERPLRKHAPVHKLTLTVALVRALYAGIEQTQRENKQ